MSNKDFVFSYSQDYATWLDERGYARPQVREGNRLPTPAEVLSVLNGVAEGEVEVWGPYAFLSPRDSGPRDGRWLTLQTPPRGTWDDETWDGEGFFTIRGDIEREIAVAIALAGACGQLVIYPDTGAVAVIVDATDDPSTIARLLAEAGEDSDEWQVFHRRRHG